MINLFVQVGLFLTDVHSLHKFQLEIGRSQSFEVLIKMIGEFFKVVPKDYLPGSEMKYGHVHIEKKAFICKCFAD